MSKALRQSLNMDLPALADMIRAKGRKGDSILAHISPKEAALLKRRGGSGTTNPDTGLPEFYGEDGGDFTPVGDASFQAPAQSSDIQPITPSVSASQADANMNSYGFPQGGQQVTLPGEQGNIPAYQAYGQQPRLVSPSASGGIQYGFPTSNALPPTNIETPSAAELKSLQVGGPQDTTTPTKLGEPGYFQNALNKFIEPTNLSRLGLATGLGIFGAGQARKSAGQIQAAQGQQQQIATPYQSQGQSLVAQAQAGQLSPASQQAYKAAEARMNQNIANRGGVGVQQAAQEMAALYQTLLNNQYTYGLNVMQIGDNIALGAIKTGLQLDTQLNQITNSFYTNLAQMAVGGTPGGTTIKVGG